MAFWVCYDHLGKLVVVNVCCFLFALLPVLAAYGALVWAPPAAAVLMAGAGLVLLVALVLPLCAAGLAAMMKELIETRDGSVTSFWRGMRRFGLRAAGIGALLTLAEVVLWVSVWFYATQFGPKNAIVGYGLSAVALWTAVFVCFLSLLVMPALVQKDGGVLATLKLAALLVLDNPLLVLGLAFGLMPLALACAAPPVVLLFSLAPMMAVVSSGYEMLSRRYAALEAFQEQGVTGNVRIDFGDEEDDYLNRGFRDMVFPWKS